VPGALTNVAGSLGSAQQVVESDLINFIFLCALPTLIAVANKHESNRLMCIDLLALEIQKRVRCLLFFSW
jgi:hypothetical protein